MAPAVQPGIWDRPPRPPRPPSGRVGQGIHEPALSRPFVLWRSAGSRIDTAMAFRGRAISAATADAARQSLEEQIQNLEAEELKRRALNGLLKLDQTEQTKAAQGEFERARQSNRSLSIN